uniref:Uncharacterized protein n=1 Tax=Chromera velia CCMP2878 TaxID=1169474 RepID=A0A0G4GUK6_9ALVE|eukprot:Cvel_23424.t1-p1 / transcript=Cvel_23424.t1 / gene=Cvel_23424 / organism=Chromera_velia_CCMP2878 / gene_product=hypothetical protein / transcript_product=hypothetical protein / location=Cvel_scaffold2413:6504-6998(+) / protein_length=79 / sequence_SO=supercontig / SO=protein_coding / is_pseudo=false
MVERIDIEGKNGEGVQAGAEEKAEMGGQGDENPSRLPEHHAVGQPEVRGYKEEESPASEGDDDVMEELFGDKRLDEEEN